MNRAPGTSTDPDSAYCDAELRRLDYDRWLTTLFAPTASRPALQALYAFNMELARISEQVREPMLGRIRLQWWREALEGSQTASSRAHPVVRALTVLMGEGRLRQADLLDLVDARETDLDADVIQTLDDLVAYAASTAGRLAGTAAKLLGTTNAPGAIAGGTAYGLVGLMRALPHHAAMGRVYLPRTLLAREGMTAEEVAQRRQPDSIARIVETVADRARLELHSIAVPRAALATVLPAALARVDLKALASTGYDVFSPRASASMLRRQVAVLLASLRGRL